MTCPDCATTCEAIGEEPFVIFVCLNCGQVVDPEKPTFDRLEEEEFWT